MMLVWCTQRNTRNASSVCGVLKVRVAAVEVDPNFQLVLLAAAHCSGF